MQDFLGIYRKFERSFSDLSKDKLKKKSNYYNN